MCTGPAISAAGGLRTGFPGSVLSWFAPSTGSCICRIDNSSSDVLLSCMGIYKSCKSVGVTDDSNKWASASLPKVWESRTRVASIRLPLTFPVLRSGFSIMPVVWDKLCKTFVDIKEFNKENLGKRANVASHESDESQVRWPPNIMIRTWGTGKKRRGA